MKFSIIILLCFAAAFADDLSTRPDVHKLHLDQHKQNVEEAKKKISDVFDRHQSSFENIGSYSNSGFGKSSSSLYDNSESQSFSTSSSSSSDSKCLHPCTIGSIPVHYGTTSAKFLDSSDITSKSFAPDFHTANRLIGSGSRDSSLRHDLFHSDTQKALTIPVYTPSKTTSESYSNFNERRELSHNIAPVIKYTPSVADSEKYLRHDERRIEGHSVPMVHYSSPLSGTDKYLHQEQHQLVDKTVPVYQTPIPVHRYVAPAETQESYLKYKKVASSISEPQLLVTPSSYSQRSHSSLDSTMKSGLSSTSNLNFNTDSLTRTGYDTSSAFDSRLTHEDKYKNAFKLNSNLNRDSTFGSTSSLDSGSTGLYNYIQEAERLAKAQAQGLSAGSSRTGGSLLHSNYDSDLGISRLSDGFDNYGNLNKGGYKTKSWEKSSKWSSQSEYDSDGLVKNYNELSTGESEQYDINGQRSGYKAATATLDDNGKVSSYSLHT